MSREQHGEYKGRCYGVKGEYQIKYSSYQRFVWGGNWSLIFETWINQGLWIRGRRCFRLYIAKSKRNNIEESKAHLIDTNCYDSNQEWLLNKMKTRISRLRPGDGGFNQISVKSGSPFCPHSQWKHPTFFGCVKIWRLVTRIRKWFPQKKI